MTIDNFIKEHKLPKLKEIGVYKNCKIYKEAELLNEDSGIPLYVIEREDGFHICNSDLSFEIMDALELNK